MKNWSPVPHRNNLQPGHAPLAGAMFEQHFSVRTIAELWSLSDDWVQRRFEDEPGVLKIGNDGSRGGRRKITLRIPRSVAERVFEELTR